MVAIDSTTPAPRRVSIRRPLSLWIGLATGVLLIVGLLACAIVVHRQEQEKVATDAFFWVMLGLFNYIEGHDGCLPEPVLADDNGEPRASWRFLIWNYIDATDWYIPDEKKPWVRPDGSEIDVSATAEKVSPFTFWKAPARGGTRIAAITGPGSAFDEENRCSFLQLDDDTIILVEVANTEVRWTQPGDCASDKEHAGAQPASMKIGSSSNGRAFHVAFKDREVWSLSADVPLAELSRFFTAQGARENDREAILGRWRLGRSQR